MLSTAEIIGRSSGSCKKFWCGSSSSSMRLWFILFLLTQILSQIPSIFSAAFPTWSQFTISRGPDEQSSGTELTSGQWSKNSTEVSEIIQNILACRRMSRAKGGIYYAISSMQLFHFCDIAAIPSGWLMITISWEDIVKSLRTLLGISDECGDLNCSNTNV
jgi:hypothetical protein